MATQLRNKRAPFSMNSLVIAGSLPLGEIPKGTHQIEGTKRRWEELADAIREVMPNGESIVVELSPGSDPETVRQGVAAEMKRYGLRSRVRTIEHENHSFTLYMYCIDPKAE